MKGLRHGDCLNVLSKIETGSFDMVFADPPFNVGKNYAGDSRGDNRSDYYSWCSEWIGECYRVLSSTGTFYLMTIDRHLERLLPVMSENGVFINLVKWRNSAGGLNKNKFWPALTPIMMYGKTDDYKFNTYAQTRRMDQAVVSWNKDRAKRSPRQMLDYWDDIPPVYAGSVIHPEAILIPGTNKKVHPTQMPIGLSDRCILFSTDKGDVVLDPFAGSGTVGISCMKLKRGHVGIENKLDYINLISARWAEWERQLGFGI